MRLLLVFLFLLVAGCELLPTKTRRYYVPSEPDTVTVRDTVYVDDDDKDDKPRWRP